MRPVPGLRDTHRGAKIALPIASASPAANWLEPHSRRTHDAVNVCQAAAGRVLSSPSGVTRAGVFVQQPPARAQGQALLSWSLSACAIFAVRA